MKSTVSISNHLQVASVIARTLRERRVNPDVHFASNREFLRQGLALYDTLDPDRVVVGAYSEAAITALRGLAERGAHVRAHHPVAM